MAQHIQSNRPLHPNPYSPQQRSQWHAAYAYCLRTEQNSANNNVNLMYARLLGYLILESPGDEGRNHITDEIVRCNGGVDDMIQLAKLYQDHLLRLFRQQKCYTPTPSYHPSRRSSEEERFFYSDIVDPAPKDHSQAKKMALLRDGHQCMVTGVFDDGYFESLTPDGQQAVMPLAFPPQPTSACHIFPLSTNMDLNPEKEGHANTHYAASVWSIVDNFGGIRLEEEFNDELLHRLSNIMTMATPTHLMFDKLRLWFEEVPNTLRLAKYDVCSTDPAYLVNYPPQVIFTTTNPDLALPDKRYLRLHAAVCRVACMSGAAKYLDRCDREHEGRDVLARDGSSAEYLTTRLQRALLVA